MVNTTIDLLVKKKLHLGHPTRDWNPKMAPYIYTKRNGFYIIDLLYTYSCLEQTKRALRDAAAKGSTFLFVGTKRQASLLIKHHAERCNSFYINHKWSGGLLTNWQTVSNMTRSLIDLQSKSAGSAAVGVTSQNQAVKAKKSSFSSKKEAARLEKQMHKLEKTVGGIRDMKKLPDIVIIIGAAEESNAVRECNKLGIPVVAILDTNCDPRIATWGVPGNDDSIASIDYILEEFSNAILSGFSLA